MLNISTLLRFSFLPSRKKLANYIKINRTCCGLNKGIVASMYKLKPGHVVVMTILITIMPVHIIACVMSNDRLSTCLADAISSRFYRLYAR